MNSRIEMAIAATQISTPTGRGESYSKVCECSECQEREEPCHCDCDPDENECRGCYEARMDAEDARFAGLVAQGRY